MKKILKSRIFAFILGVIVTVSIGIGVYALSADQITYNDTTVDSALDNLYNNIYDFTNYTKDFNISNGSNIKRTSSLNVTKGTYLVLSYIEQAGSASSYTDSYNENYTANLSITNGQCKNLTGKHIFTSAPGQFISQYLWGNAWYTLFLCDISANDTISISNFQTGTYNETFSSVFLDAIKIK